MRYSGGLAKNQLVGSLTWVGFKELNVERFTPDDQDFQKLVKNEAHGVF
jgi:hypothetical protein